MIYIQFKQKKSQFIVKYIVQFIQYLRTRMFATQNNNKRQEPSKVILLFTLVLTLISLVNPRKLQNPISFTVVREINPSADLDMYLTHIGAPSLAGQKPYYNLISLDGFYSNSNFSSMDNTLSPILSWKKMYQIILGNKAHTFANSQQMLINYVKQKFHQNGSRVLMNVNLQNSPISQLNKSANSIATNIIETFKQLNLDGISIQFRDQNAIKANTASDWIQSLLRHLRVNLRALQQISQTQQKYIITLIVPVNYVLKCRMFKQYISNSYVDYYILKYYDLVINSYNNYQTLFERSPEFPGTALFQLMQNPELAIDICRTVIAKPVNPLLSISGNQFMSSSDLRSSFSQAYNLRKWFGGFANLYYSSDTNQQFASTVLGTVRSECLYNEKCVC